MNEEELQRVEGFTYRTIGGWHTPVDPRRFVSQIRDLRKVLAHYAAAAHWAWPGLDYPDYDGHAVVLWLGESNPNELALNALGWPHKDRYPETPEEALAAGQPQGAPDPTRRVRGGNDAAV